jgi:hypothetical protein
MRFLYFYLMKDAPARVQATAPGHAAYWHDLGLRDYLGGPFADRSGGLITFHADSGVEAERLWPTTRSSRRACSSAIG